MVIDAIGPRFNAFGGRTVRKFQNKWGTAADALLARDGVFVALAVALVADELVEELPHAVSARLASATMRTVVAVGIRLRLLMV